MEVVDRQLQKTYLERLAAKYPFPLEFEELVDDDEKGRPEANLSYLREHGLVAFRVQQVDDEFMAYGSITITAAGIDFISNDGGLTAILGVMTIKLHDDDIRKLLIDGVKALPETKTVQSRLIDQIKDLPSKALEKISMAALERGLKDLPNLVHLLVESVQ